MCIYSGSSASHPGVTCDRTGQSPIVGVRYKLRDENYDVCAAEFAKMGEAERATYDRIEPPAFRKVMFTDLYTYIYISC